MIKTFHLKYFILVLLTASLSTANAQKIDSIYVNLYTDSLKKGTFNYINIDGLLSTGTFLPLDSTQLIFTASAGKFSGNSLWIDKDFTGDKVTIKAVLRSNPSMAKQFDMHIKRKPDNEKLKTAEEIMGEINNGQRSKKKGRGN
jgi:hypothetical protein